MRRVKRPLGVDLFCGVGGMSLGFEQAGFDVAASYERIHYGLRPAKNVQRKMFVETLRRLAGFGAVDSYRYVGFGSTYFSDFNLFHKALGIRNMISIERDVSNRKRFEFNCPFNCIRMAFGNSTEILPTLTWHVKTILWLDYDSTLESSVLTDVKYFCASAVPGSIIIVTVNAEPSELDPKKLRLDELRNSLGKERVPPDVKEADLSEWGTGRVFRRILLSEILETLSERNGGLTDENKIEYNPLFYFCYRDGDRMMTTGGLLYERGQEPVVAGCGFNSLDFLRFSARVNARPCFIEVPKLTYKEIRHLDRQLPRTKSERLRVPKVPPVDIKQYENIYRYFPTFAETEV